MSRGARIAEELWGSGPGGTRVFERADVERLPAPARLYMEHAIAPGTPLANAVRLRLRGEIKLRRWLPFTAEQVVHRVHGFIWRASARMNGLAIRGFDRLVDGEGEMQWKLLGLFPVMTASGPDISRSAAGRFVTESAWLPSMFCSDAVSWTAEGQVVAVAHVNVFGEPAHFAITVDEIGRAMSVKLARWGQPGGGGLPLRRLWRHRRGGTNLHRLHRAQPHPCRLAFRNRAFRTRRRILPRDGRGSRV